MNKIIIAHYNEDLNWVLKLNNEFDILIYSKTNKDYNMIDGNKGQEVPMYLKYIIDNYDNLPEKNLFLHGHQNSLHQDYPSDYIIRNVNWENSDYFSVNRRDWYQEVSDKHQISNNSFRGWLEKNWEIFQNKIDFPENGLFFYSGAQFVVSKKLIKQYDIDFYQNLFNFIQKTDLDSVITSRIFEYTWHYIFTKQNMENKYDIKDIFNI